MRTYTFEIGDKTYTLKYDYNALCDIEEISGQNLQSLFSDGKIGVSSIRLLLWGGLKWKLNGITKQQVGFIMGDLKESGKLDEVIQKAGELIAKSIGKGTEEEDKGE